MDDVLAMRAARFFMWGAVVLLVLSPFIPAVFVLWPVVWFGMSLFVAGWRLLWRAIRDDDPRLDRRTQAWIRGGFVGAILGFLVGLASLPASFPEAGGLEIWAFVLITGLFAFVPTVTGPILVGHAVSFLAGAGAIGDRRAKSLIASGCAALVGLAAIGAILQIREGGIAFLLGPIPSLVGWTAPGYAAIALGWRTAARSRRSWPVASPDVAHDRGIASSIRRRLRTGEA